MKNKILNCCFLLGLAFFFLTCNKEALPDLQYPNLPTEPYDYVNLNLPSNLSFFGDNTPFDNQLSNHGATLGRVLFYDPALSINNSVSCNSCHKQHLAFADGQQFSKGFKGEMTSRNSMAIFNHRFARGFFWDMREISLESQVLQPVEHHIEMGMEDMDYLVPKIQGIDYYPALFEKAFGTDEVTEERLGKALAQFLRSMVSANSRYDQGSDIQFANFTEQEREGLLLLDEFRCTSCHSEPTFSDWWSGDGRNIGLDLEYADQGMGEWHGSSSFNGKFKVPTLRNIALTAPYMHDGRFNTLEEVLDFYSTGIQDHPNLNFLLTESSWNNEPFPVPTTGNSLAVKMNMTDEEKSAIIAALNTLTDETFIRDPKFGNPFR